MDSSDEVPAKRQKIEIQDLENSDYPNTRNRGKLLSRSIPTEQGNTANGLEERCENETSEKENEVQNENDDEGSVGLEIENESQKEGTVGQKIQNESQKDNNESQKEEKGNQREEIESQEEENESKKDGTVGQIIENKSLEEENESKKEETVGQKIENESQNGENESIEEEKESQNVIESHEGETVGQEIENKELSTIGAEDGEADSEGSQMGENNSAESNEVRFPDALDTNQLIFDVETDWGNVGVIKDSDKHSIRELWTLEKMAEKHFSKEASMTQAEYFYRDKNKSFFDEAESCGGIMKKYVKDNSGDPKSPINGKIDGLFFATSQPPQSSSYFGDTRLLVPAPFFLSRQAKKGNVLKKVALYFADFYCMDRRSARHWVTLVLTYEGSEAYEFCDCRLPRLNLGNNPFLMVKDGPVSVRCSEWDRVEILYTEDLDLNYWKENKAIVSNISSQGTSTRGGKPKRPSCTECNL